MASPTVGRGEKWEKVRMRVIFHLFTTHYSRSFPTQQLNNSPAQHFYPTHDSRYFQDRLKISFQPAFPHVKKERGKGIDWDQLN